MAGAFGEMHETDMARAMGDGRIERLGRGQPADFGLDGQKNPHELSEGMKVKFSLALALSHNAELLILDEPTNDLDVETLELLEELIDGYQGTVLLVSHDRQFVDNTVTECWIFEGEGRIGQYVGGYHDAKGQQSQSLAQKQSKSKISSEPAVTKAETVKKTSAKLSYNLQRELEQLPQRLEELETQLQTLRATQRQRTDVTHKDLRRIGVKPQET